MSKILCASQNTCLQMFASLVILDGFHLLLSTQLTADLTPEWSGGSMIYPLSHIHAKTPFCCYETVANNALNHRHVVAFGRMWANAAPIFNTAFSLTDVHAKWWIHCLLISSTPLLSHVTSIYDQPKWVCGVFWCFPRQLANLCDLSIQHHLCLCHLISIPYLNHHLWWSKVRITLIKLLLCLNSIFSIWKQCFTNSRNSDFPIVLKICISKVKKNWRC